MGEAYINRIVEGAVGPTGPTGAKGATGAVGPTGATGASSSCTIESQYIDSDSSTGRTTYSVTFSFNPKIVYYIGYVTDGTNGSANGYRLHGILADKGYGLWIKGTATSAPISIITKAGNYTSSSTVNLQFYQSVYNITLLVVALG
jgi:hypothetical protein